jgi:hypothetical protein
MPNSFCYKKQLKTLLSGIFWNVGCGAQVKSRFIERD